MPGTGFSRSSDLGDRGSMAFREVAVPEIREALRAWLDGAGLRRVAERAGWTARRRGGMWRPRSARCPAPAPAAATRPHPSRARAGCRPSSKCGQNWRTSTTPKARVRSLVANNCGRFWRTKPVGCGPCAPPLPHRTDCCFPIRRRGGVKRRFACTFTRHFDLRSLPCGQIGA